MSQHDAERLQAGIDTWCEETEAFMWKQVEEAAEQERLQRDELRRHREWEIERGKRSGELEAWVNEYHAKLNATGAAPPVAVTPSTGPSATPYLGDEMANSQEEKEMLHKGAMAYYARWQADQRRRWTAYDARVDAYHARLNGQIATGQQHDAHVGAYYRIIAFRDAAE